MAETTALAIKLSDDKELCQIYMQSGLFKDTKDVAQAIVKIHAGRSIGLTPFESMSGLNIISGNITVGGNVQAAKVKDNPKYDYRIIKATNEICEIDFFEIIDGKREKIGTSTYTIEEVKKITYNDYKSGEKKSLADKDNWKNYPSDMLFNRCISRGRRRYCPDVFGGARVYDPEELSNPNEPIDITPKPEPKMEYQPPIITSTCVDSSPIVEHAMRIEAEETETKPPQPAKKPRKAPAKPISEATPGKAADIPPTKDKPKTGTSYPFSANIIKETPYATLEAIMEQAMKDKTPELVRPVIEEIFPRFYVDADMEDIPEEIIITIVERLTGVRMGG